MCSGESAFGQEVFRKQRGGGFRRYSIGMRVLPARTRRMGRCVRSEIASTLVQHRPNNYKGAWFTFFGHCSCCWLRRWTGWVVQTCVKSCSGLMCERQKSHAATRLHLGDSFQGCFASRTCEPRDIAGHLLLGFLFSLSNITMMCVLSGTNGVFCKRTLFS